MSSAGPDWQARLAAIQAELVNLGVDAVVISTLHNVLYLCGFGGSAALLVITRSGVRLITDGRYAFAVRQQAAAGAMASVDLQQVGKRYDLTLGEAITELGLSRVAFEPAHVTVATLRSWERAAPGVSWTPADNLVENARVIKDAYEIAVFRRGGALIAKVIEALPALVRPGLTDRAIATEIERALTEVGFSRPAFETIVASGPNSALPHARPTDRSIGPGDLVLLDFGGVLDGYCVDVTRMSAVGPLSDRAIGLFEAVKVATEAAISAVRPGILASDVDRAARDLLTSRGLGEAFMHSTGHGLGLDVHEAPRVGRADPEARELMQAGMVFTIEPGAYIEGLGGVRLEDDVLVTTMGSEVLTPASRDLLFV
jgi:Xaa-Pro aminopeptidase